MNSDKQQFGAGLFGAACVGDAEVVFTRERGHSCPRIIRRGLENPRSVSSTLHSPEARLWELPVLLMRFTNNTPIKNSNVEPNEPTTNTLAMPVA